MAKGDARCLQRAEEQWGVITRKDARRHLSASQVQSKLESGGVDALAVASGRMAAALVTSLPELLARHGTDAATPANAAAHMARPARRIS
jgi:hypothetical protein